MEWTPIAEAPRVDYEFCLLAVPCVDEDGRKEFVVRIGMFDPENDDWTVFGAVWNPKPAFYMPMPKLPEWPADYIPEYGPPDRLGSAEPT